MFNEKDTEKYESINIFGDDKADNFPEATTNHQLIFTPYQLTDEQVSSRNFYHITLNDYHLEMQKNLNFKTMYSDGQVGRLHDSFESLGFEIMFNYIQSKAQINP